MKIYRHNRTGETYELITDNFMFKDEKTELGWCDGEPSEVTCYSWKNGLILYKSTNNDASEKFFARHPKDFYDNFTEID